MYWKKVQLTNIEDNFKDSRHSVRKLVAEIQILFNYLLNSIYISDRVTMSKLADSGGISGN